MKHRAFNIEEKKLTGLNSFHLHLLAMLFMLLDHLWATVVPGQQWMTCVGRLAFPIFAFLTAEGYFNTGDYKKYVKRMLFFALISEIPFNLVYAGSWFYPFHQNVLWTFVLALLCMKRLDKLKERSNPMLKYALMALTIAGFMLSASLAMTDYYGYGLLMVLVFYVFRGKGWFAKAGQLAAMIVINGGMIKGLVIPIEIRDFSLEIRQQSLAVLALLPIWLYDGTQGPHNKKIQCFYYMFYPVHLLLLWLLFLLRVL